MTASTRTPLVLATLAGVAGLLAALSPRDVHGQLLVTPDVALGGEIDRESTVAVPNEGEVLPRLQRARELLEREDWPAAFAVIDEILGEFTTGDRTKTLRNRAIQRRRELERVLREIAEAAAQPNAGGGGQPKKDVVAVSDDESHPTIELTTWDGSRYRPVVAALRERLATLPDAARASYVRTFEPPAARLLEAALEMPWTPEPGGSEGAGLVELRRLAERYPVTPSGRRAFEELAARLADLGRPAEAAAAIDARLALPTENDRDARLGVLVARSALYHLLAGNGEAADRRLTLVAQRWPDDTILVGGLAVLGSGLADAPLFAALRERTRGRSAALPADASLWPNALGDARHAGLGEPPVAAGPDGAPSVLPELGTEARWIERFVDRWADPKEQQFPGVPAHQLVVLGDALVFRRDEALVAVDRATGEARWRTDVSSPDASSVGQQYFGGYAVTPGLPGTSLGASLISAVRSAAPSSSGAPGSAALLVLDRAATMQADGQGNPSFAGNRILAIDPSTGKCQWRLGDTSHAESRLPGDLEGLTFLAPPVPCGEGLVVSGLREGGYYMLGLDLGGEIRWVRRLYSFNLSDFQRYASVILNGAGLAASTGVAFAVPGDGVVSAVAGETGEVLWVSRYERDVQSWGAVSHPQPLVTTTRRGTLETELLVTAAPDSPFLSGFDARTGERIWSVRLERTGIQAILGADADNVYLAGPKARAFSLEDGTERWSTEIASAGSLGFLAAGKLYVPAAGGRVTRLDAATGEIEDEVRCLDPRVLTSMPYNLFPTGADLALLGPAGLWTMRPEAETRDALGVVSGATRFREARVLRGLGRHQEALDVLYALETEYRDTRLHQKIVKDLIEATDQALDDTKDPALIARLLANEPPLVTSRTQVLAYRLREADLTVTSDRARAIDLFAALLGEDGRMAPSPEAGITVDVRLYASARIAELSTQTLDENGAVTGRRSLEDALAESPLIERADGATRRLLGERVSVTGLQNIAVRRGFTPSAVEAAARLSAHYAAEGDARRALHQFERVLADAPELASDDAIRAHLESLRSAIDPPTEAVFRWRTGESTDGIWREELRKEVEDGVLVATSPGSAPFPVLFVLTGSRLRALHRDGLPILDRELPQYPDVSEIKVMMEAAIEEPAIGHYATTDGSGTLVVFTAAGIYAFRIVEVPAVPAVPAGDDPPAEARLPAPIDASSFRLAWYASWEHPLDEYTAYARGGMRFGSIQAQAGQNVFPEVAFADGDPIVLHPTGELVRYDRRTGKVAWRFDATGYSIRGPLDRQGNRWTAFSSAPAGLLLYEPPSAGARGRVRFVAAPDKTTTIAVRDGIANAFSDGSSYSVVDDLTDRVLWTRNSSSRPIAIDAEGVWTSGNGNLKVRSLRTGRPGRSIELPEGSTVHALWDIPTIDDGWTLLASSGAPVRAATSYSASARRTGQDLHLVRVDAEGKKRWSAKLADGPVTFEGRRYVLEDGHWLFAFNQEKGPTGSWYTRVVTVDPTTGAVRHLFESEISGSGSGQFPRICAAMGGLGIGNADGFAWYSLDVDASNESGGETTDDRGAASPRGERE